MLDEPQQFYSMLNVALASGFQVRMQRSQEAGRGCHVSLVLSKEGKEIEVIDAFLRDALHRAILEWQRTYR